MSFINSYRYTSSELPSVDGKVGVSVASNSYFIDVDGFDNLTGSGDYTFIAWYNASTTGEIVFWHQNNSLASPTNRFEITSESVIYGGTRYGGLIPVITTEVCATVVVKQLGLTDVYHLRNGVVTSTTGLSVPNSSTPTVKAIGNSVSGTNTTPTGDIVAIQYIDSALSSGVITDLLNNKELYDSATTNLLYFENTSGSSDNGAYPATMVNSVTPAPYAISGSGEVQATWLLFDGRFSVRSIQNNGAGGSAGAWIKFDHGAGNSSACDKYLFRSWAGQGANSFTVAGSNDDSSYTDLYTGTGNNNNTELQSHTWVNSTNYRYYRITCNTGFLGIQWTSYQHILIDQSKEWQAGAGYAKDLSMTFPV